MTNGPWLVVIDHQQVFADPDSAWAAPRFADTEPVVADLARQHGDQVVLTRWVPAHDQERVGSWRAYFDTWPFADRPADDPLFELTASAAEIGAAHTLSLPTFGKWGPELAAITGPAPEITLVGVSTDCCVLSTALAAADAGATVRVIADGCAGSSDEAHERALSIMAGYAPQIEVYR